MPGLLRATFGGTFLTADVLAPGGPTQVGLNGVGTQPAYVRDFTVNGVILDDFQPPTPPPGEGGGIESTILDHGGDWVVLPWDECRDRGYIDYPEPEEEPPDTRLYTSYRFGGSDEILTEEERRSGALWRPRRFPLPVKVSMHVAFFFSEGGKRAMAGRPHEFALWIIGANAYALRFVPGPEGALYTEVSARLELWGEEGGPKVLAETMVSVEELEGIVSLELLPTLAFGNVASGRVKLPLS